jgi:hypothetical protein
MARGKEPELNHDEMYDRYPSSAEYGFGPDQGFNRWVQINDERLFTSEALDNPVIRAFVEAPFSVNYAQFKSSSRESEHFIHKPHLAMTGRIAGIEGRVARMPNDKPRIQTLVMNHENTLSRLITRSMVVEDGAAAAQVIHKQGDGSR